MKLATLKSQALPDGELIVVSQDNQKAAKATHIAPNLLTAVQNWVDLKPKLEELYNEVSKGSFQDVFSLNQEKLHSPLPRTFQWADGSAFIHHIKLVRMARNAPLPETLTTVPLMYQGAGDTFLAPYEDIPQIDFTHGTDFEGEVAVVTDHVPMGVSAEKALDHIILFLSVNDVSLRGLIPDELKMGFGFFHGKPSSSFGPFAITHDELGYDFRDGRIHLPLLVNYNNEFFGKARAGEMHFSFGELIAHAAKTRELSAGTIIGSGTVSNEDQSMGSSCLAEKRMLEKIHEGEIKTPFMRVGDTVEIEMKNAQGLSLFGKIKQKVVSV